VEFVCGGRTLRSYGALRDVVSGAGKLLSVHQDELVGSIERLQQEAREARRSVKDMQGRLAVFEAAALAANAVPIGPAVAVVAVLEGWDAGGLKTVASAIAERPRHIAVLVGAEPAAPIVVACAPDANADAAAILKSMIGRFGGKGGGRPALAQGGGLQGEREEILAHARTAVATSSSSGS
jgi:alanyl-tRNA synthetase